MASELALFVLWEKSRFVEERILADLWRETSVRYVKELRFEGDPALAFRRWRSGASTVRVIPMRSASSAIAADIASTARWSPASSRATC